LAGTYFILTLFSPGSEKMGWKGCFKSMVLMVAFMVAMVVVQHVECVEGGDHVHDSPRKLVQNGGFVQRSGTNFVLNNKRFYFNGFNAYWLMFMASDPSTRPKVTSALQQASSHGLTVARTWAFNDGAYRALQVSPGSYDEKVFRVSIYYLNPSSINLSNAIKNSTANLFFLNAVSEVINFIPKIIAW